MNFKKLGIVLTLSATFGLMACGDDSSSASNTISCKVSKTESSYKSVSKYMGEEIIFEVSIDDNGIMTTTETSPLDDYNRDDCEEEGVTCKDNKFIQTYTSAINLSEGDAAAIKKEAIERASSQDEEECLAEDGKTLEELLDEAFGE